MAKYKYPAKYRHKTGTIVEFTSNGKGVLISVGEDSDYSVGDYRTDYSVGDYRTDWTGPEGNSSWVLVPEISTKQKLHEAVSKLKQSN